jgi:hypothetical protein
MPADQLQVMAEVGGGLHGNCHASRNMEMTDVAMPPAFAALPLQNFSRSLFVSSF